MSSKSESAGGWDLSVDSSNPTTKSTSPPASGPARPADKPLETIKPAPSFGMMLPIAKNLNFIVLVMFALYE